MTRILLAGLAAATLAGCQLGYFVRAERPRRPVAKDPIPRESIPAQKKPGEQIEPADDRELLERGNDRRISSKFDDVRKSAAGDAAQPHPQVTFVPTCVCSHCSHYRRTHYSWGRSSWPSWSIHYSRYRHRSGWGISWGW